MTGAKQYLKLLISVRVGKNRQKCAGARQCIGLQSPDDFVAQLQELNLLPLPGTHAALTIYHDSRIGSVRCFAERSWQNNGCEL